MLDDFDPREHAFDALLPLARDVAAALDRVDKHVGADIKRNSVPRAAWTPLQISTSIGYHRFSWSVAELKVVLATNNISFISTPDQEAQNLFLWQLTPRLTLRIKRDPAELAFEATERLFRNSSIAGDDTACLTWDKASDEETYNVRFVSIHPNDPWSISLAELLQASDEEQDGGAGNVAPTRPRGGGPTVSSTKSKPEVAPGEDAERPH